MNTFTLALVSSLLLATLVITASDKIGESHVEGSGGESAAQLEDCSDRDDCDEEKCCKSTKVEGDMITVSCSPKPEGGASCNSETEYIGQSKQYPWQTGV
uniref:Putative ixodegrin protein n=1 Tax=Ixodes ricinus TaxID=34613 RepID=A0A0K8R4Y7_IXORI